MNSINKTNSEENRFKIRNLKEKQKKKIHSKKLL